MFGDLQFTDIILLFITLDTASDSALASILATVLPAGEAGGSGDGVRAGIRIPSSSITISSTAMDSAVIGEAMIAGEWHGSTILFIV